MNFSAASLVGPQAAEKELGFSPCDCYQISCYSPLEPRPIENKCLTLEVRRADSIRRLCNRIFLVELAAASRLLTMAGRASAKSTLPAKSVVQSLSDLCSLRGWCCHASLRPIECPHSSADAHLRSPRTMAPIRLLVRSTPEGLFHPRNHQQNLRDSTSVMLGKVGYGSLLEQRGKSLSLNEVTEG